MKHFPAIASFVFLVATVVGCGSSAPTPAPSSGSAKNASQQEFLKLAFGYLDRLDQFDPHKGMRQLAYYLNRWIEDGSVDVEWTREPMIQDLPRSLREIQPLSELDKREFTTDDVLFLREVAWADSISQWVIRQDIDLPIAEWLEQIEQSPEDGPDAREAIRRETKAYDLEIAFRLFDWCVRNLQLVPLLDYPGAEAGPAMEGGTRSAADPIRQAVGGPGYTLYPWQNLLYGYADAWQRARVFVQLARQQGLDVVMLAFDDPRQMPRPRPWLAAVLIDGELYLFDPQLGLPIPGPGFEGIATLAQVRENPQLLKALDVGEDFPYAAARADLDELVVLIDAAPETLSYRMRLLESLQPRLEPLILTVDASALAGRLRNCDGVSRVQLWNTPFETWVYRTALRRRCEQEPSFAAQVHFHEGLFDGLTPMVQGRMEYFRGRFEKSDDSLGAKGYFLQACIPDSVIEQIPTSEEVQQELGIIRGRQNDEQWEAWLGMQQERIRRMKSNVVFWLGQTQFEAGDYDQAIDWFKRRTIESEKPGPWIAGARYSLARTYEALGKVGEARNVLLLDASPQQHGNLLRARLLRRRLEAGDLKTPRAADSPDAT